MRCTVTSLRSVMQIASLRLVIIPLLVLMVIIPGGFAQINEYDINLDIIDSRVDEEITIAFDTIPEVLRFTTEPISDISVEDNLGKLDFEYNEVDRNKYELIVNLRGQNKLILKFTSYSLIFQSGDFRQLFLDLSSKIQVNSARIVAKLPEGFAIASFSPENGQTSSDGRRVIVSWDFDQLPNFVSIKYEPLVKADILPFVGILILVIFIGFLFNYYRKKTRAVFLSGFMEDEKKVVEILMKQKIAYQNKIEHELKFSRAKMTRIVKKLEQKGLIEKTKRGRTNKLRWK